MLFIYAFSEHHRWARETQSFSLPLFAYFISLLQPAINTLDQIRVIDRKQEVCVGDHSARSHFSCGAAALACLFRSAHCPCTRVSALLSKRDPLPTSTCAPVCLSAGAARGRHVRLDVV